MGLFSRKRDAEGLYRGDAPVSAPGFDGAAPGAYTGATAPDYAGAAPDHASAAPAYSAGQQAADPPPYATAPGVTPFSAGPHPAGPGTAGFDPETITTARQVFVPGGQVDPETAARVRAALADAPAAGRRIGRAIGVAIVIAVLVPAGIGIYFAISQVMSVASDAQAMKSPDGIAGRNIGVTTLGEPVSIRTGDAAYDITVFGAETQTGSGWGYDFPGSGVALVVDAQISRTDAGPDPVEFTGWNWSVVGADGTRVLGEIISHFEPSLDGPELVGGQTVRGYVSFNTPSTGTSLTVAAGPSGVGLATWRITAATPRPVEGVIGEAARPEISRPGFTVTVGQPEVLAAGDEKAHGRPASGSFLVLPVEFAGVAGAQGNLGIVQSEQFVFMPAGAPAMLPTFAGVHDSFSFVSVDAAAPAAGSLAFDTAATSGRLELRNQADQPIVTWQIG